MTMQHITLKSVCIFFLTLFDFCLHFKEEMEYDKWACCKIKQHARTMRKCLHPADVGAVRDRPRAIDNRPYGFCCKTSYFATPHLLSVNSVANADSEYRFAFECNILIIGECGDGQLDANYYNEDYGERGGYTAV